MHKSRTRNFLLDICSIWVIYGCTWRHPNPKTIFFCERFCFFNRCIPIFLAFFHSHPQPTVAVAVLRATLCGDITPTMLLLCLQRHIVKLYRQVETKHSPYPIDILPKQMYVSRHYAIPWLQRNRQQMHNTTTENVFKTCTERRNRLFLHHG